MSNQYKADPNDDTKQIPNGLPTGTSYGAIATVPAIEVIQERPDYVLINVDGTYSFNYDFTGSIGLAVAESTFAGQYITGSVLGNAAGGPVRLDISPTAWRQTNTGGTVGDVTFVYRRR